MEDSTGSNSSPQVRIMPSLHRRSPSSSSPVPAEYNRSTSPPIPSSFQIRQDSRPPRYTSLYPPNINTTDGTSSRRPPQLNLHQSYNRAVSNPGSRTPDRLHPMTPFQGRNSASSSFNISPANSEPSSPHISSSRRDRGFRTSSSFAPSYSRTSSSSRPGTPHPHGKPSVKHMTCFWWKEKGECRFSEEDCLYSHHDTGLYADPPRQVLPGEPAVAGRSLDRALQKLHAQRNPSSTSLRSLHSSDAAMEYSRPTTPNTDNEMARDLDLTRKAYATVQADNNFLKGLLSQNSKENAHLISTIEILQAENKDLKKSNADLKEERDMYRNISSQLQTRGGGGGGVVPERNNPFGPIGPCNSPSPSASRFFSNGCAKIAPAPASGADDNKGKDSDDGNMKAAELEKQNAQLKDMLRNYGHSL